VKFGYYDRLTSRQKAIYRKSDAVGAMGVPDSVALEALVSELECALSDGKRLATAKAASSLVAALCQGGDKRGRWEGSCTLHQWTSAIKRAPCEFEHSSSAIGLPGAFQIPFLCAKRRTDW